MPTENSHLFTLWSTDGLKPLVPWRMTTLLCDSPIVQVPGEGMLPYFVDRCVRWRVSNLENWYPVKAQTRKLAPYSKEKQTLGIAWMVRLYFVSVAFKANRRFSSYSSFVFPLARHLSTANLADCQQGQKWYPIFIKGSRISKTYPASHFREYPRSLLEPYWENS